MNSFIENLSSLQSAAVSRRSSIAPAHEEKGGASFRDLLQQRIGGDEASPSQGVHFSKHAAQRLQDRHIKFSDSDLQRLEKATEMAASKGARDALMMLGNVNLIVNVNNRTVVTAMQPNQQEDMVFTNIDTAVMLGGNE